MIWLTGANGMLGRHIAETLTTAGIPHVSTDIDLDITDETAVKYFCSKNSFKCIINCSAYTAVDLAEDESAKAFAVNSAGVKNIASAAKVCGGKIIHFSADYVFPGTLPGGYTEDDETGPESVYGASKLAGEMNIVNTYDKYFIISVSWLYGPYGKNFVHTMLNLFKDRDELNVVNDQFGSPTCTGELADFIVNLIKLDSTKYGLYHFSGEGKTDWHHFAAEIYKLAVKYNLTSREVKINPVDSSRYPAKAKRPMYSYMLKDKLYRTFSYRPGSWRVVLEEYLKMIKLN